MENPTEKSGALEGIYQMEKPERVAELAKLVLKNQDISPDDVTSATNDLEVERKHVLDLVREDSAALQHQPELFRGDEEVVLVAARHDFKAARFATERLKSSLRFGQQLIDLDPRTFEHLSHPVQEQIMADSERAMLVVRVIEGAARLLSQELRNNRKFALDLVELSPLAFTELDEPARDDITVALRAIEVYQNMTREERKSRDGYSVDGMARIAASLSPRLKEILTKIKDKSPDVSQEQSA